MMDAVYNSSEHGHPILHFADDDTTDEEIENPFAYSANTNLQPKQSIFNDNNDLADLLLQNELNKTIRINVGGTIFETLSNTISTPVQSCLSELIKCPDKQPYYRADKQEYFFDHDPEVFRCVLNYHRFGELHLPLNICGPFLEREFKFWGIDLNQIEKCCWLHYNTLKSQKNCLLQFEHYFKEPNLKTNNKRCNLIKNKIWLTMTRPQHSKAAQIYAIITALFIMLSICMTVIESIPELHFNPHHSGVNVSNACDAIQLDNNTHRNITSTAHNFSKLLGCESYLNDSTQVIHNTTMIVQVMTTLDYICAAFFTADLILVLITSTNKRIMMRDAMFYIELLALFPYYLDFIFFEVKFTENQLFVDKIIQYLHILRILRILRIFKLLRHYKGFQVLVYTLKSSFNDLLLMLTFIGVAILMFASLIYYVDDRTRFTSILVGFWWAIITITTVGYGDYYPTYFGGQIVGSICALIGVLVVAFTVPILVSTFTLYYSYSQTVPSKKQKSKKQKSKKQVEIAKMENDKDIQTTAFSTINGSEKCLAFGAYSASNETDKKYVAMLTEKGHVLQKNDSNKIPSDCNSCGGKTYV